MIRRALSITLIAFLMACGSQKEVRLAQLTAERMDAFWSNQLDYDYLSLKSKLGFTDRGNTTNVNVNLMMKKDSILWARFSLVGFEAARALITKDSFHLINRLNNTYMVRSVDYLKYYLGFDVELKEIQDIMLGNAPFRKEIYSLTLTDTSSRIQGQKGSILNTIGINEQYRNLLSAFSSTEHIQSAEFTYLEYKNMGGNVIPTRVEAKLFTGDRQSEAKVSYSDLKTDPIAGFPFYVPENFKRI